MATVVAAAALRAVTCLGTWLLAGPLLGLASLPFAVGTALVGLAFEYAGAAVATGAGLVIAVQVTDGRYRSIGRARVVGGFVVVDTAFYLASTVVGVAVLNPDFLSVYLSAPFLTIVMTNLALIAGAVVILRRPKAAYVEYAVLGGPHVPRSST
ncbi:hypothetical protein KRMM14A1004_47530 [Krasilnikovia sp. MM14-A1004]